MSTSDRFLVTAVAAILVIGAVALALAAGRRGPSYREGTAPEDIVHNYILALEREDYEVALAQLSPDLPWRPASGDDLYDQIRAAPWGFPAESDQRVGYAVLDARVRGERAVVTVQQRRYFGSGLFDSARHVTSFEMDLVSTDAGWKVLRGQGLFLNCWAQAEPDNPCRR